MHKTIIWQTAPHKHDSDVYALLENIHVQISVVKDRRQRRKVIHYCCTDLHIRMNSVENVIFLWYNPFRTPRGVSSMMSFRSISSQFCAVIQRKTRRTFSSSVWPMLTSSLTREEKVGWVTRLTVCASWKQKRRKTYLYLIIYLLTHSEAIQPVTAM